MDPKAYARDLIDKKFPALTHRSFRIFWVGQCVSLLGNWMQNIGLTWLVLSTTNSPFLLGLMETMRFLPITLFSLFAGVFVDRYSKRNILLATQIIAMVLSFVLAAMAFTGSAGYAPILVIAVIFGFVNTIYMPARQSFTIEIAGREDLVNAIALSSITANLTRVLGPAFGALILASIGAGWCFFLNGLSFLAVILSLMNIENTPAAIKESEDKRHILADIKDGLSHIAKEKQVLQIILIVAVMGIFTFNYDILVPVFTRDVLHQSGKSYGFLMSAMGIGALIGAVMVSLKGKVVFDVGKIVWISILESALLIFLSFTGSFYFTAVLLVLTGVLNVWFNTASNSTLQLTVKDEYRGRVMSSYFLVYSGTASIGYMFSGTVMDKSGAGFAFLLCGILAVLCILLLKVLFRKHDKPSDIAA